MQELKAYFIRASYLKRIVGKKIIAQILPETTDWGKQSCK